MREESGDLSLCSVKTFYSLLNWLRLEERRLPVIVTVPKPTCWHCGETGHLSAICLEKALLKTPDRLLLPATAKGKHIVRTSVSVPVGGKPASPTPSEMALDNPEKLKEEWLTVGKDGRKVQLTGTQSQKVSQADSLESPHTYAKITTPTKISATKSRKLSAHKITKT